MPIEQHVDRARGLVYTTITGIVTMQEIRRHVGVVRARHLMGLPELIDARSALGGPTTPRELLHLAHLAREVLSTGPVAPRAVIVGTDDSFGRARIFASFVAGWLRMGVFQDEIAAREWLANVSAVVGPPATAGPESVQPGYSA
jgi:hypothetical protein